MTQLPFFLALGPRWFGSNRLFRLYLLPDALCGARVAGQIYDAEGAHEVAHPAGWFGLLLLPWIWWVLRKRQRKEIQYDALSPGSPEFLAADKCNFVIRQGDVERVVIKRGRSGWTGWRHNSGSIEVVLSSQKKRRFVLVGAQDVARIKSLLAGTFGDARVEDGSAQLAYGLCFMCLLGLTGGLFLLWAGLNSVTDELQLRSRGVVTPAQIHERRIFTDKDRTWYEVRYTFAVPGWQQRFDHVDPFPLWRTDLWSPLSQEHWEDAQKNGTIDVVYLPENPRVNRPSVPEGSPLYESWAGTVLGAVLALIFGGGLWMLVHDYRSVR